MKKYTVQFNGGNQHEYPSIVVNVVDGFATPEDARRVREILNCAEIMEIKRQRDDLLDWMRHIQGAATDIGVERKAIAMAASKAIAAVKGGAPC